MFYWNPEEKQTPDTLVENFNRLNRQKQLHDRSTSTDNDDIPSSNNSFHSFNDTLKTINYYNLVNSDLDEDLKKCNIECNIDDIASNPQSFEDKRVISQMSSDNAILELEYKDIQAKDRAEKPNKIPNSQNELTQRKVLSMTANTNTESTSLSPISKQARHQSTSSMNRDLDYTTKYDSLE